MNVSKLLIFCLLIAANGTAWGQQCPPGIAHGTPGCIPPNNAASPLYRQDAPVEPPMVWADRWGAIATDELSGSLGAVTGMQSERKAKTSALTKCRANGGNQCKVDRVYYNQCAAMIVGNRLYYTAQAPTVDEATSLGTRLCSENDSNCRIYYSACSMAERIQ